MSLSPTSGPEGELTAAEPRRGLAIMVWSCGPGQAEQAATPFVVAQAAVALELEVEMLFSARAVHWLQASEQDTPIGFGHGRRPVSFYLGDCARLGVRMRACSQALAALGLTDADLAPACRGAGGTLAFVERTRDPGWGSLVF